MKLTSKLWQWWMLLLTVVPVICLPCAALAQDSGDLEEIVQRDVQSLSGILNNADVSQAERDEAAKRLADKPAAAAEQALAGALVNVGNWRGQMAVARALAEDPDPSSAFITPLIALIGPNRELTEAAASALASYQSNAAVQDRLIALASSNSQRQLPPLSRIEVIRALGRFSSKEVAGVLVTLATADAEPSALRAAASNALAEMTALNSNGEAAIHWEDWWRDNQRKGEEQFRADILESRAGKLDRLQPRYAQLAEELRALLAEQYQRAPADQKENLLLRYLRSPQPQVRVIGARIIRDDFAENLPIPDAATQQLRTMVGDSSAEVRLAVAQVLRDINDDAALDPLMTQLAQERDPGVRAALAQALAPIGDLKVVPLLLRLLSDASPDVAIAAASSLKELGGMLREKQPGLASNVATELSRTLSTTGSAGTGELREAVIEAMVPLRNPDLRTNFIRLLRPNESVRARRAALRALGELGELGEAGRPWAADIIVGSGALDDPEDAIRLEAVRALGKTATSEHAETLYERLKPIEPDPKVQQEAWNVLASLFPEFENTMLATWADRFMNDPERRLTILQHLKEKLIKDRDTAALAIQRQNIGEMYMKLQRPAEAAVEFEASLEYYRARDAQQFIQTLVGQLMDAHLAAGAYEKAIDFAGQSISGNPGSGYETSLGAKITQKAESLRDDSDFDGALLLINLATTRMRPQLVEPFLSDVKQIEQDVRNQAQKGQSPGAQSASRTFPAPDA